jgi:hypothetical protein
MYRAPVFAKRHNENLLTFRRLDKTSVVLADHFVMHSRSLVSGYRI